jgi:flagellar basal body rod protein FlgF
MNATATQQDAIAHNLSHAMKPGYLREIVRFEAPAPSSEMVGPTPTLHTDFAPGTMQQTGNKLDLSKGRGSSRSRGSPVLCTPATASSR